MSKTRVMVSSTCYDLKEVRRSIEQAIEQLGHEPVLSDRPGTAVPPALTTTEASEWLVSTCDVLVLVIGGRYGHVDEERGKSITSIEFEAAVDLGKTVYVFVDHDVIEMTVTYETARALVESGKIDEARLRELLGDRIQDPRVYEFIKQVDDKLQRGWRYEFSAAQDIINVLSNGLSILLRELLRDSGEGGGSGRRRGHGPVPEFELLDDDGEPTEELVVEPAPALTPGDAKARLAAVKVPPAEVEAVRQRASLVLRTARGLPGDLGPAAEVLKTERDVVACVEEWNAEIDASIAAVDANWSEFLLRWNPMARASSIRLQLGNRGKAPATHVVFVIESTDEVRFYQQGRQHDMAVAPQHRPLRLQAVLEAAKPAPEGGARRGNTVDRMVRPVGDFLSMRLPMQSVPVTYPCRARVAKGVLYLEADSLQQGLVRGCHADDVWVVASLASGATAELPYLCYAEQLPDPIQGTLRVRAATADP